jgi:hypothetical protein
MTDIKIPAWAKLRRCGGGYKVMLQDGAILHGLYKRKCVPVVGFYVCASDRAAQRIMRGLQWMRETIYKHTGITPV